MRLELWQDWPEEDPRPLAQEALQASILDLEVPHDPGSTLCHKIITCEHFAQILANPAKAMVDMKFLCFPGFGYLP